MQPALALVLRHHNTKSITNTILSTTKQVVSRDLIVKALSEIKFCQQS